MNNIYSKIYNVTLNTLKNLLYLVWKKLCSIGIYYFITLKEIKCLITYNFTEKVKTDAVLAFSST